MKQQEPFQVNEKKLSKLNIIGIIIATIMVPSYWVVQKLFFCPLSLDQQLMTLASELNKSYPIMVDAQTQLDSSLALPNNIFQYNYTFVNIETATVDTNEFKDYMEPNILEQVKTNIQVKYFRDNNVTLNYLYRDKNGQYVALITITPEMYKF